MLSLGCKKEFHLNLVELELQTYLNLRTHNSFDMLKYHERNKREISKTCNWLSALQRFEARGHALVDRWGPVNAHLTSRIRIPFDASIPDKRKH